MGDFGCSGRISCCIGGVGRTVVLASWPVPESCCVCDTVWDGLTAEGVRSFDTSLEAWVVMRESVVVDAAPTVPVTAAAVDAAVAGCELVTGTE